MRQYTARVDVTLPKELKERLKARAKRRGISLGALMRDIMDEALARDELEVACGHGEMRMTGATIQ